MPMSDEARRSLDQRAEREALMAEARKQLKWKRTLNTNELVVWAAGDYEIHGKGRIYGGGIRRDWSLYCKSVHISDPSRLSEAKNLAVQRLSETLRLAKQS